MVKILFLLFANSTNGTGIYRPQIRIRRGRKYLQFTGIKVFFLIRCAPRPFEEKKLGPSTNKQRSYCDYNRAHLLRTTSLRCLFMSRCMRNSWLYDSCTVSSPFFTCCSIESTCSDTTTAARARTESVSTQTQTVGQNAQCAMHGGRLRSVSTATALHDSGGLCGAVFERNAKTAADLVIQS